MPEHPKPSKTLSLYRNVCTPKFWVPNTLIEGHIPWFEDPKPKGTNPKGTKDNSLKPAIED